MDENNEKKVYTIKEVAKILGISFSALYKMAREENLPFKVIKIGSNYRVPKKCFDEWFEHSIEE